MLQTFRQLLIVAAVVLVAVVSFMPSASAHQGTLDSATKNSAVKKSAQEQGVELPDSLHLSLDEAMVIALSDNATIQIANTEIERQRYVRRETVGRLLPSLSATGNYSHNLMLPVMFMPEGVFGPGTGGAMQMGFSNSFTGNVSLALPLIAPALWANLSLNKQQMLEAVEKARSTKIDLTNSVRSAYYSVLLSQSSLELIEENIKLAQEVVDDSQRSYNQGVMSQYDLLTAQVQLSNLAPTLYQAQSALHNSKLMFNMLLGLPLQTIITPKDELTQLVNQMNQDYSDVVDLENNSQLKLLGIQRDMLTTQLRMQRANRIPTLSAIGQYTIMSQSDDFKFGQYDWRSSAVVGLQLAIPIFNGMSNVNKERQIKSQREQMQQQLDYMLESLNVDAQVALSNIETSRKQMESTVIAKEQAQKAYDISLTRYETGAGTIVELNSAQVQFIQADMVYREAIYNYMKAQADFEKTIGAEYIVEDEQQHPLESQK